MKGPLFFGLSVLPPHSDYLYMNDERKRYMQSQSQNKYICDKIYNRNVGNNQTNTQIDKSDLKQLFYFLLAFLHFLHLLSFAVSISFYHL